MDYTHSLPEGVDHVNTYIKRASLSSHPIGLRLSAVSASLRIAFLSNLHYSPPLTLHETLTSPCACGTMYTTIV